MEEPRVHRFIVGTGRCGSTLLSKMLRENEQVASLFEYFSGLDRKQCFAREPLDAETFTALLCDVHPITAMVLARGYRVAEVAYPFDVPGARYSRESGLPFVLGATLSSLPVENPDAFYDEVRAFLSTLPPRPAADQHLALFEWIAKRLGKSVWVERSGGSIDLLDPLNALFPDARFLHIHRAGEEAALSMREHHVYRLGLSLMFGLRPAPSREDEDEISRLLESRPPAEYFGRAWTDQLLRGFRALRNLDAHQYREVRFEDLIAHPRDALAEIAEFLELPDPDGSWPGRAAALVQGVPPTRAGQLPDEERARLEQACRPVTCCSVASSRFDWRTNGPEWPAGALQISLHRDPLGP